MILLNTSSLVQSVAGLLHNTPTVCRGSYVHPQIISSYMDGEFLEHYQAALEVAIADPIELLDTAEGALLQLLPRITKMKPG